MDLFYGLNKVIIISSIFIKPLMTVCWYICDTSTNETSVFTGQAAIMKGRTFSLNGDVRFLFLISKGVIIFWLRKTSCVGQQSV